MDKTFFKLWRNKVINRVIFNYLEIYKRNKVVVFDDLESIRSYGEREYITKLVYNGDTVSGGYFPDNCSLKEIEFTQCSSCSEIIPNGVEIVGFSGNVNDQIRLSELPSSVNTVCYVVLKKPYSDNQIPENITSISFSCNIDPIDYYQINIHSKVVKLGLNQSIQPHQIPITPSIYFPSSVTDLTTCFNGRFKFFKPLIPSSITKLHLNTFSNCNIDSELIPFGVKYLTLNSCDHGYINFNQNSLPESITKLSIICSNYNQTNISQFTFPNSLACLVISCRNKLTFLPSISDLNLPSSIKYLKINDKEISFDINLEIKK